MNHLIYYVENSLNKVKLFKSKKKLNFFVLEFTSKYMGKELSYWIELMITDIKGDIFREGKKLNVKNRRK